MTVSPYVLNGIIKSIKDHKMVRGNNWAKLNRGELEENVRRLVNNEVNWQASLFLGGEAIKIHRRNEDFISYKIEWREQLSNAQSR